MRERLVSQRTGIVNQIRAFLLGNDLRTISDGDELTAYFCLCAESVCFLPFPVGTLQKNTLWSCL